MSDEDVVESEGEGSAADDWGAAMAEQSASEESTDNAEAADIPALSEDAAPPTGDGPDLESILDIPVTLSVEIGNTKICIRNLLQLNQGSVVELDRLAGEPLDVLVNGTLVAHGEVVVVNEKFGIRLTDVISTQERVKKLN